VNPNTKSNGARKPATAPESPMRFRVRKLEERIAPKKGGKGTNNCPNFSLTCEFCGGY